MALMKWAWEHLAIISPWISRWVPGISGWGQINTWINVYYKAVFHILSGLEVGDKVFHPAMFQLADNKWKKYVSNANIDCV